MTEEKTKKMDKDDSWSGAINKVVNIVIVTILISIIFGFSATFGGLWALRVLA